MNMCGKSTALIVLFLLRDFKYKWDYQQDRDGREVIMKYLCISAEVWNI